MLNYIWLEHPKMERLMHIIRSVKSVKAGDDTEGKAYETICGKEFFSLQFGPPQPSFGTQEEGLARGGSVCSWCAHLVAKTANLMNNLNVKGMRCPVCGHFGECYWRDVDRVGFYGQYTFYCPGCGFRKQETKYGGSSGGDDWPTRCSFCGKEYDQHRETPRQLR